MSNASPYEVLGIDRNATADEIKAAYRRAASRAHPDREDAEGDMAAINAAYEVLSDPVRRAQFDATGVATERRSIEEEALAMLLGALRQALESDEADPLGCASRVLDVVRQQLDHHIATQQAERRRLAKFVGRFHVKQGENLAQGMVSARMSEARTRLAQLEHGKKVNELARGMLTNYSFDAPAPPVYTTTSTYAGGLSALLGM